MSASAGQVATELSCTTPESASGGAWPVSAVLTTKEGHAVPGASVVWSAELFIMAPASSPTDETGGASSTWVSTDRDDLNGELETITAQFAADSNYAASKCEVTFPYNSHHLPPPQPGASPANLVCFAPDEAIWLGNWPVGATLTTESDEPVEDATIEFAVSRNAVAPSMVATDDEGTASTYWLAQFESDDETVILHAWFYGSDTVQPAYCETAIVFTADGASPPPPDPGLQPTEMECMRIDDPGPIPRKIQGIPKGRGPVLATLADESGTPLAGLEVRWVDSPSMYHVEPELSLTDQDGVAEAFYQVPYGLDRSGVDTVKAIWVGDGDYAPSSCELTFEVESPYCPFGLCDVTPDRNQGDNNCDGQYDTLDVLANLRYLAGRTYAQKYVCPSLGKVLQPWTSPIEIFGDVNCDGTVDALDALAILRHVAGLLVFQNEPCRDIGSPL